MGEGGRNVGRRRNQYTRKKRRVDAPEQLAARLIFYNSNKLFLFRTLVCLASYCGRHV